jgi:threonine dehydrogenase-like Zn-dependent dehydrogenase
MNALFYDGELRLIEDYPIPTPPSGEALVRVKLAGICNTDVEILRGYMGFRGVLGHEFVGVVKESEERSLLGKRVVGEINAYCGKCSYCNRGIPTHCPNRTTLGIWGRDGAFADFLSLPESNLHIVPEKISDEEAVFTEPLAAALEIIEQVHIRPTDEVVVLGDGKLGLLVAQVLSLTGCELITIGHHKEKLEILERMGIKASLAGEKLDIKADVVVDCTGHPSGFPAARALLRPRGKFILKSTYHGPAEVDLTSLVVDEVTLFGSRCGPFPPALNLLERGLIEVKPLISAIYPLREWEKAFEMAKRGETLKVLLRP